MKDGCCDIKSGDKFWFVSKAYFDEVFLDYITVTNVKRDEDEDEKLSYFVKYKGTRKSKMKSSDFFIYPYGNEEDYFLCKTAEEALQKFLSYGLCDKVTKEMMIEAVNKFFGKEEEND